MTTIIALILFLIFLFLSSIHIYWGFGGQWGNGSVIPTKDDNIKVMMPGLLPTFIVAFGLLGFGLFVFVKSKLIDFDLPTWLDKYGLWIIAGIFFYEQLGNLIM